MPSEVEMQRSTDFQMGRLEGRVDGLETRIVEMDASTTRHIEKLEASVAQRFTGVETKLDVIGTHIASTMGASSFGSRFLSGITAARAAAAALAAAIIAYGEYLFHIRS
jgi:hypothetical protein